MICAVKFPSGFGGCLWGVLWKPLQTMKLETFLLEDHIIPFSECRFQQLVTAILGAEVKCGTNIEYACVYSFCSNGEDLQRSQVGKICSRCPSSLTSLVKPVNHKPHVTCLTCQRRCGGFCYLLLQNTRKETRRKFGHG